jgi:predicted metal-dependent HD superfamily phosphohydrolase
VKYKNYIKNVREEYSDFINDSQFREGRKKFVNKILTRKILYYTKEFYEKCEVKARINLMSELD